MKSFLSFILSFLIAGAALAQTAGTVTLSVSPTSGNGSVTPTVTWSTSPTAISCTASGGWSGTKAASGTQPLSAVTANTDYTLTCAWSGGLGRAEVAWTPPTTNTDGSALTDLANYRILYGTSATSLTQSKNVSAPASGDTITGLANGTWFFAVRAMNAGGIESGNSNVTQKTVAVANVTASRTVSVTVNKVPSPPTNLVTVDTVVYNLRQYQRAILLGNAVGVTKLGTPCGKQTVVEDYKVVARSNVRFTTAQPPGTVLVVKCGAGA